MSFITPAVAFRSSCFVVLILQAGTSRFSMLARSPLLWDLPLQFDLARILKWYSIAHRIGSIHWRSKSLLASFSCAASAEQCCRPAHHLRSSIFAIELPSLYSCSYRHAHAHDEAQRWADDLQVAWILIGTAPEVKECQYQRVSWAVVKNFLPTGYISERLHNSISTNARQSYLKGMLTATVRHC